MATIFKTDKGTWAFRIKIKDPISGKTIDTTGRLNASGEPFKTKREAEEARAKRILEIRSKGITATKKITLEELYKQYKDDPISHTKAYSTLRKQDSMWEHHLKDDFGHLYLQDISVGNISSMLSDMYYGAEYSYDFVNGILKFWYMLFSYAYRYNYISDETYNKMLVNKATRITMPAKKIKDNKEIRVFNEWELSQIEKVVKGSNFETAYYLGRYAGLRISESFSLLWEDVDFRQGTISINKQLVYIDGIWKFTQPKSKHAIRTIEMPSKLEDFLIKKSREQAEDKKNLGLSYRNTERIIDERTGEVIIGADLINRKRNGEILTQNVSKFYTKLIKEKTGIEFKYHWLRHTYGSRLACSGLSEILLKNLMGHSRIQTTEKYYLGSTTFSEQTLEKIEKL